MVDDVLTHAARLCDEGRSFVLVTIVRTAGSTPRKAGAKMIVCDDGSLIGTVGGGRIEQELVTEARAALESGEPRMVRHHLTHDLAMCCGGEVEAFLEPMGRRQRAVLIGGGHINAALAPLLAPLRFEVTVVDEMEEFASAERFPGARLVHSFAPKEWGVPLTRDTYLVIATRDHAVDQRILEDLAAINESVAYLGVIGSRGKMGRFRKRFEHKGLPAAFIERVRGPIGVEIGADTPEEIAIAVAAELIAVRQKGRSA